MIISNIGCLKEAEIFIFHLMNYPNNVTLVVPIVYWYQVACSTRSGTNHISHVEL